MRYIINWKGRRFTISKYILCDSLASQMRGLMFRSKSFKTSLVFTFNRPVRLAVHSLFVPRKFLAAWFRNGKMVEARLVNPWSLHVKPKEKFDTLVETPM